MRVAVIDMGTNTFHLLIVEVAGNDFSEVHREKRAVKIGEKGINKDMITPDAEERALTALREFHQAVETHHVERIFATATSAIRNAKNGRELVAKIKEETGIETRVISGLEEAEYIYYGVKRALNIGSEPGLIMDIGGGSIEFIIGTSEEILWKQSFEIGGLRMVDTFQKHDPILPEEIEALKVHLDEQLSELYEAFQAYLPETLIGSSGTFDTLSDIYRMQHGIEKESEATEYPLTIDAFKVIYKSLLTKDRDERLAIPGMIPLRVDMIVVACALINHIIDKLDLKKIRVSAYALKEGVLLRTLDTLDLK